MTERICAVGGCERKHRCRGFCDRHYQRFRRYGDPLADLPIAAQFPAGTAWQVRFWAKVEKTDTCWVWTAALRDGYGRFAVGKRVKQAQLAWELIRGPIPADLVLDHLCRNPRCVNPEHLDPVTQEVNIARGVSIMADNLCVHGHEFTPENTWHDRHGDRKCRSCAARIQRELRRRRAQLGRTA